MPHLALLGGSKTICQPFPTWPQVDDDDRRALLGVLDSKHWWMYGQKEEDSQVAQFEREFAGLHRVKRGVAVTSGSMALDICIKAMGIGPGDEVITTPYTFVATASCILSVGAWPVFVDIDPETYNLNPALIERAITPRTRAILPVHFSGELADVETICAIANKHGLKMLEDACHAHGTCLSGTDGPRFAASFGIAGCFSFQESKNLTCGEGGMILTNDEAFADACWGLRHYGRTKAGAWYDHPGQGTNGRMHEFSAALLRSQLKKMPAQTHLRQTNVKRLYDALAGFEGIKPVRLHPQGMVRSHHLVELRFNAAAWDGLSREAVIKALIAEGVPCSPGYLHPLYHNGMFRAAHLSDSRSPFMIGRDKPIDYDVFVAQCPVAERACNAEAIWIGHPCFLASAGQVAGIAQAIMKVWKHRAELRGQA